MLKSSLTDKAHQQIKLWIIRYHLRPGTLLNVKDLAHALNMSQTPVREALSMLERERLIERQPNKGYRVTSLNLQEVEDTYDVRIALEVLAAKKAAARMNEVVRKKLSSILEEFVEVSQAQNKGRILELAQDFHVVILEASGNHSLVEMGQAILDRIWIIQNINLLTTDHLSRAHPEHLELFHALDRGDSQKAASIMEEHITSAKEFVLSRLKSTDDILTKVMMGFLPAEWEKPLENPDLQ